MNTVGIIHGCLLCSDLGLTPCRKQSCGVDRPAHTRLKGEHDHLPMDARPAEQAHGEKGQSKPTIGQKDRWRGWRGGAQRTGEGSVEGARQSGQSRAPTAPLATVPRAPQACPSGSPGTAPRKGAARSSLAAPVQFSPDSAC